MATENIIVASAVVLPETVEDDASTGLSLKRRQSETSPDSAKRRRLDETQQQDSKGPEAAEESAARRRASKDVDERKRGKRLFGALLGTLAQNSSSTAQKRRTDIERKQREKLKIQAEEDDEKKKQRLDALMEQRRREQKKYDQQTEQVKHSNALAAAHFLQTMTEPRLYYRPWELRSEEKAQIDLQIKEVGDSFVSVSRENSQQENEATERGYETHREDGGDRVVDEPALDKKGESTNESETALAPQHAETEVKPEPEPGMGPGPSAEAVKTEVLSEPVKDAMEEGGDDMVEGEEDAVIY